MKKFNDGDNIDWYHSDDVFEKDGLVDSQNRLVSQNIKRNAIFGSDPLHEEFLDLYGKLVGIEKQAIVFAHGDTSRGWTYQDGKKNLQMQHLVNKLDGNYGSIVLNVCNPGGHSIRVKQSAVLMATDDLNFGEGCIGFNIIVPGEEPITNYTLETALETLRAKVSS